MMFSSLAVRKGLRNLPARRLRLVPKGLEDRRLLTISFGPPSTVQVDSYGSSPYQVKLADLNNDGKLDLITSGKPISVHLGHGNGTFGDHTGLIKFLHCPCRGRHRWI